MHLLHTYSSTVSIFFSCSISELVWLPFINNSDDIIRYPYSIPSSSALRSTSPSSTSTQNSGPDSTFLVLFHILFQICFLVHISCLFWTLDLAINCTLLSIFYLSPLFVIGYKTFFLSRCSRMLFQCL